MKPQPVQKCLIGALLTTLIVAPWAYTSFAKSRTEERGARKLQSTAVSFLHVLAGFDSHKRSAGNETDLAGHPSIAGESKDDEQTCLISDDSVPCELARAASFGTESRAPLVIAGQNRRRDLGLYLSCLRERGPPL